MHRLYLKPKTTIVDLIKNRDYNLVVVDCTGMHLRYRRLCRSVEEMRTIALTSIDAVDKLKKSRARNPQFETNKFVIYKSIQFYFFRVDVSKTHVSRYRLDLVEKGKTSRLILFTFESNYNFFSLELRAM